MTENAQRLLPPLWAAAEEEARGRQEAAALGTVFLTGTPEPDLLYLRWERGSLSLCRGDLSVRDDFEKSLPRLRPNNLGGELTVRAARMRNNPEPLCVVDATAGFGEDALLLAAAGHRVLLFEYNPVIYRLLCNALERAAAHPLLRDAVSRMRAECADSTEALRHLDFSPDVVLLDPMFPERQKSGLIKKKFQLLQLLEAPCTAESALMEAAMAACPKKIIVKRPAKGPFLAGVRPSYAVSGNSIRYDCIVP